MRRIVPLALALVLLPSAGRFARGEEPPAPGAPAAKPARPLAPEQAADAVLAAVRAKDVAALGAQARAEKPDPWLVADELIRRGEHDAATSFASVAPRGDVEGLPAYVASRRGQPDDAARRARLAAATAALGGGAFAVALDALGAEGPDAIEDVVGVRLAMTRGDVLRRLVRHDASASAFLGAGEAAERLGWLAQAARAFHRAGSSAFDGSAFADAQGAWARARSICERRGDEAGVATTLCNAGNVHFRLGDYAQALAAYERALASREASGDEAGVSKVLVGIGNVQYRRGDYARALAAQERALAIQEARGDRAGAATTRVGMGNVHYAQGDFAKALAAQERALAAQEALGERASAARTLGNLGSVHFALGDFVRALAAQERALAAQEALGDRAGAAVTLGNLGTVHHVLGDLPKALDAYGRSLATQEALGDRSSAATTLGNIGLARSARGDYAQALAAYERELAAKEALGERAGVAMALRHIGTLHLKFGDPERALATQKRALAVLEALGSKAEAAETLVGIGHVHHERGDHAEALATYGRALAASEEAGNQGGALSAAIGIGNVHFALGDHPKALETFERVLAALDARGERTNAARVLVSLGCTCDALGEHAKATRFLERAAAAAEAMEGNELLVDVFARLAGAQLRAGEPVRALESARKAVSRLRTLVGGLGEEQGSTARGRHTRLFSTGLAAAAKVGDASEAAFFLESGRAGTLLEALQAREALRAALLPAELRTADVQARAREARALAAYQAALRGGDLASVRARTADLDAARALVVDAVERIQREAKRAAQVVYPVASSLAEVQGLLASSEVLVLYGLAATDGDTHALVVTRGAARIVSLGSTASIAEACAALDLADRDVDPGAALRRLRDLVVTPLGLPKETKRLLLSPEGPLSYVAFAALVPDLDVAYEGSGTTYGELRRAPIAAGGRVLALGDPDYEVTFDPTAREVYAPATTVAGPTRGGRLSRLPGTRAEALAVGTTTLLGKDASEPGLRAALATNGGRWRAVHFACHGLVDPDRPTLSSLALTPHGQDDGFLTALEVFRMEIPTDLVVLSACETGRGKIVGGEGIVGLTRSFMYAGSPRVVCSLWKVDDAATQALMTRFYELWNPKDGPPGLSTAEALRRAQDFVRSHERWKHPYYWAAWVLWGLPD